MKVLKFGGSSVGTPTRMLEVQKIVQQYKKPVVVVVSALQGITDQLEQLASAAAQKDESFNTMLTEIKSRHYQFTEELDTLVNKENVNLKIDTYLSELVDIVNGVYLLNDLTPKIHDRIVSYGELLSSGILVSLFREGEYLDSRKLIKTDKNYGAAKVDFQQTNKLIAAAVNKSGSQIYIAPGFIASDSDDNTSTLGRGGSDYTAAIYAAALHADMLEIWTDVDGFMTADPRKVPKAFAIDKLSYSEAMELSHFGAKVVYTPTIQPVFHMNIPIGIKNTHNPEAKGTLITANTDQDDKAMIKGVSSIDDIDLITIQGPGMVGVKGISSRLFGALAGAGVNIILITQASSEYSISFAISPEDSSLAVDAIEREFEIEILRQKVISILQEKKLSIIAIVGERMKNTPGISATLFTSLGRNGISVIATAQGSSELNISVVIKKDSLKKALNVIHEGFFLSHYKELHLYLVGVGTVGGSLIRQIQQQQKELMDKHLLKVNMVGIMRSKKMLLNPDGIQLADYKRALEKGEPADLDKFIGKIREYNLRNSVFIDCTADDQIAGRYKEVLDSFVSIVTANKVACSSEYSLYSDLKQTAKKRNVKFMFETNVGAGLPIINTINDLIRSGDRIVRMEAVLSGTLNFIFNELSEKIPMSKAVQLAKEKGFSEPDPRIDLSGIDVIRKLLILARESGYPLERWDIKTDTFLPEECFEGTLDDFWGKIKSYDSSFEEKRKKLVEQNKRWRFVATLDRGKGRVGLREISSSHPAFELKGSSNIILITTERYCEEPMVIRGYGAGAAVTAAGVFSDIIRIVNV